MIVPLALSAYAAFASQTRDFSVDLFLVAENKSVMQNLDWIDKPEQGGDVEKLLRPAVLGLAGAKKTFAVIDGGDCSIFPSTKEDRQVKYLVRSYSSYDAMTETITVHGVSKTRVLARSETTSTMTGGVITKPLATKSKGYMARTYCYFDEHDNDLSLSLQDLNSYSNATRATMAQDREGLDRTLIISSDSVQTSRDFIRDGKYDFNGICICTWGLPDPKEPNFISFPPAGMVGHYKLFRQGGKWGVRFLEYLR